MEAVELSLARTIGIFTAGTMTVRDGAVFYLNSECFAAVEGALRAQGYPSAARM